MTMTRMVVKTTESDFRLCNSDHFRIVIWDDRHNQCENKNALIIPKTQPFIHRATMVRDCLNLKLFSIRN